MPCLILDKARCLVGRFKVLGALEILPDVSPNACPMPEGDSVDFSELDIASLSGKINIWTKNRVLISGEGGDSKILRRIILEDDLSVVLKEISHQEIEPQPVMISEAEINFDHAAMIGNWRLQWNDETPDK